MKRRNLLRNGLFVTAGASVLGPMAGCTPAATPIVAGIKRAKNIIFMVSDGMSQGTLTMADQFLKRRDGRHSHWMQLYLDNRMVRSVMDTSSASSVVTDSAAAGSAWGGGLRINNGALNVGPSGERPVPILQKFKQAGKAVGCVTTVPITHATPASFCINNETRKDQPGIAEQYIPLKFDVMMGGGLEFFTSEDREDGKDVLQAYRDAGFAVALNKSEVNAADSGKPLLGVFGKSGLRAEHLRCGHGKGLECREMQLPALSGAAPQMQGGQQVKPGAETQLGDVESVSEAGGKAVARKKDMHGFRKPALQRKIRVAKLCRDGKVTVAPSDMCGLVLHGGIP